MTKIACFTGGVTSNPTAAVQLSKTKHYPPLLCPISNPDPKSIDAKCQQMPDEEALQYVTFVPNGQDLIEHFDSALKRGINHIIMLDLTPVFIALNMAPPEAAHWPMKVLPHLRDKYK